MDINLSDIQTVMLTPAAPAIVFAAVVGLVCGAIAASVNFALSYKKGDQWPSRRYIVGATAFDVGVFELFTVGLSAVQLSENPTVSLQSVYESNLSNAVLLCAVLCFTHWQSINGRSFFGKNLSAEQKRDD